jgi:hypothetical protein
MEQIRYQGYARERGFNPIQVSNANVESIGQQGQALLRQMRENQQIERSNRDAYLSGQETRQRIEQQNRDANFEFSQRSRERYQQGVQQNLKTNVENAVRNQQNLENNITAVGALASLAPSLNKVVLNYQKNKDEADEIEGMNLVSQYGVSPEKLQRYKESIAKLDQADATVKRVVNQLEFEGTPVDVLEKLTNLSGRKLYGATKMYAIQGAMEYPLWRAQNGDTELNEAGLTLNGAKSEADWETANALLRTQFQKQFLGINPILLNEHLFPKMGLQETTEKAQYLETLYKVKQQDMEEQKLNDLRSMISDPETAGEGALNWVRREAGVGADGKSPFLGQKGRELFKHLTKLATDGLLEPGVWEKIKSHSYTHNDGSTRKVSDTFALYAGDVEKALTARQKEAYQNREFQDTLAGEELDDLFQQKYEAEGFSDEELEQAKEKYAKATGGKQSQFLSSIESRTSTKLADSLADQHLTYLSNRGLLTSKELLRPGKYSETLIKKYKDAASNGDKLGAIDQTAMKAQLGILNARASELLEQTGADKKDSSAYKWVQVEIERVFKDKALDEIRKGNQAGAIGAASEYVNNLLWDGKESRKGPFAMTNDIGSLNPYVGMGKANTYVKEVQRVGAIAASIDKDSQYLENNVKLTAPEMKQLQAFATGRGGSLPPIIFALAAKSPSLSPVDIINAQLKAAGIDPLQPVYSEEVRQGLSPYQRRILEYRPSSANTYQSFGMNNGPDPYRELLNLIADKESAAYGHYDAMNRGGYSAHEPIGSANSKDVFGVGLSNMTVAQIMELQKGRKVHAAGRYQIIAKTLGGLMAGSYGSTGVNLNDPFNAATQDKLAIALLRGRAGRFFSGSGTLSEAIVGMGNEWSGLEKVSRATLAKRLETVKARLNSPNMWRQPENIRTGVVYKIGSLGYGSTGPHLDLKRVDRGTMKSTGSVPIATTELDQYVEVQTKGAWKPLSKGTVITDGEKEHRSRSRSSYGIDYAAPAGTPVRLKNGAVAVGSFKGDGGTDHLIIQLPDGRRFQFLHGTNA